MKLLKLKFNGILNWSQKYTRTDMKYITKGSFWITGGTAILAIISIITMIAFANLLSVQSYGIYQFVISTAGVLSIFALPSIGTALVQAIASGKTGIFNLVVKSKIKWSLIGSVVILGISGWYFLNDNHILAIAFIIAGLTFPLRHGLVSFENYWHGKKRFDRKALFVVLSAIGAGATTILALFLTDNILIIILAFFVGHIFFDGIFFFYTKLKIKEVDNPVGAKETFFYGFNLTLMQSIETVSSHIDKIIIWKFLGPVQVAIYSFAQLPINKLRGLFPVSTLALPKFSENGVAWRKNVILYKTAILFAITIPIAVILILLAPFLYQLVFPQYIEAVPYFQVLAITITFLPITLIETGLVAEKAQKYLYIIKISSPTIKIILFLILGFFYGIWGIIFSIIISEIIRGVMLAYFFLKL